MFNEKILKEQCTVSCRSFVQANNLLEFLKRENFTHKGKHSVLPMFKQDVHERDVFIDFNNPLFIYIDSKNKEVDWGYANNNILMYENYLYKDILLPKNPKKKNKPKRTTIAQLDDMHNTIKRTSKLIVSAIEIALTQKRLLSQDAIKYCFTEKLPTDVCEYLKKHAIDFLDIQQSDALKELNKEVKSLSEKCQELLIENVKITKIDNNFFAQKYIRKED